MPQAPKVQSADSRSKQNAHDASNARGRSTNGERQRTDMVPRAPLVNFSRQATQESFQKAFAPIQARKSGGASAAAPSVNQSSQPLANGVRSYMESAFGTSFSDVRIHQGSQASSVGALAYTQGNNIHFAKGQYNPTSSSGLNLLGHELTHVVQQRSGRVKTPQGKGGLASLVNSDPALEAEADVLGARAARGERVHVGGVASGPTVQPMLESADGGVIQCLKVPLAERLSGSQKGLDFRQDEWVGVDYGTDNPSGLAMTFNPDLYPHISETALEQYIAYANSEKGGTEDANFLTMANTMTGAIVPGDPLGPRSPIKRYYFLPGMTGVTMTFKDNGGSGKAAAKAVSTILTGDGTHQIPEGDPRHLGTHSPKDLGFLHRHVLKMPPARLTATEIEQINAVMNNPPTSPPKSKAPKSSKPASKMG